MSPVNAFSITGLDNAQLRSVFKVNTIKFVRSRSPYHLPVCVGFFNPFPPISANWHLSILLCLTLDDFTRQWGTPWEVKG